MMPLYTCKLPWQELQNWLSVLPTWHEHHGGRHRSTYTCTLLQVTTLSSRRVKIRYDDV